MGKFEWVGAAAFLMIVLLAPLQAVAQQDTSSPGQQGQTMTGEAQPDGETLAILNDQIQALERIIEGRKKLINDLDDKMDSQVKDLGNVSEALGRTQIRLKEVGVSVAVQEKRLATLQAGTGQKGATTPQQSEAATGAQDEESESLGQQRDGLEGEIRAARETLAGLTGAVDEKTRELVRIEDLMSALDANQQTALEATAELAQTDSRLSEARAALEDARRQIGEIDEKTAMAESAFQERQTELADRNAALADAVSSLENDIAARRARVQDVEDLEGELAQRRAALAEVEARQKSLTQSLAALEEDRAREEAAVSDLAAQRKAREEDLAGIEAQIDDLNSQAEAEKAETAALAEERARRETDLSELGDRLADGRSRLEEVLSDVAEAEDRLANLDATALVPEPAPLAAPTEEVPRSAAPARNRQEVAVALRSAPGLAESDSVRVQRLQDLLVDGVCPTAALQDSFGEINRQTLLALVRSFGAC